MMKFLTFGLFSILLFAGCQISLEPIAYGKDQCNYCKMNIVDRQHAAQVVTIKGKQYKFDAIECLVNNLSEFGEENLALVKITDFENRVMIDAQTATYLICPEIKSPMGAFLSGFSSQEDAIRLQEKYSGNKYNWIELKNELTKK